MATEARRLQLLVLQDAEDVNLKPFIRAQLARAYRELGEFRLRLQGKGPPKAVDYAGRKPKKSGSSGFSESPAAAKVKRTKVSPSAPADHPTDTPAA